MQEQANVIATSVRVYSRAVIDDSGTLSRYEYNGSFTYTGNLDEMSEADKQGHARAFDTFFDVLFIKDGCYAIQFIADHPNA